MPEVAVQTAARRRVTICLTGGGTAGHVTPHFALLPGLRARGWNVFYVGSNGLEKPLVEAQGIEFFAVSSGKLRRYMSVDNVVDAFKVLLGCLQAFFLLLRRRPDAVFSKGGFVSVPVAAAAWALRIPVISHESDLTPGLATRIIAKVAKRILFTFPETQRHLPGTALHVGSPVRAELFLGDRERGLRFAGFDPDEVLPTWLVMGGSLGAQRINENLKEILPGLMQRARVIHITGAGKGIGFKHPRYKAFEFVGAELKDVFAAIDFVVSRAGANSIFEFLALKKPMLLIPLEQGSRGDQVINAAAFAASGWAHVLKEAQLRPDTFKAALEKLMAAADGMRAAQGAFSGKDAAEKILGVLESVVR